jgi:hypothetical protein
MGQLGDVLEVLFGPDDRFHTVRASIRHWLDRGLADRVRGRQSTPIGRKKAGTGSDPGPKVTESTLSIWLSRPSSARIEQRREADGCIEKLTVTDGNRRWECDCDGHVEASEGEHRGRRSGSDAIDIDVDRHFSPSQIRRCFQDLCLESLGLVRTAGRDCVRLRAVLRPGARLWPHWLPAGSDEYEFHADLQRGVLLAIIGRYGGEAFSEYTVLDAAFDEPLESDLFTYTPGPGEQVGPKVPVVERLTLAAAIVRMPFTVLIPARVPDPEHADFEVMYHPPCRQGGWSHLAFMYRGRQEYEHLWVKQSGHPEPSLDCFEWEPVPNQATAQKNLRISDPGQTPGMRIVAFEQQGTHVMIKSDLDRTRLIDLALSFRAASGTTIPGV